MGKVDLQATEVSQFCDAVGLNTRRIITNCVKLRNSTVKPVVIEVEYVDVYVDVMDTFGDGVRLSRRPQEIVTLCM